MKEITLPKKSRAGRKKKLKKDKVISKAVYLKSEEWDYIIGRFGSPTLAMRQYLES
jgi:hypothetical protein